MKYDAQRVLDFGTKLRLVAEFRAGVKLGESEACSNLPYGVERMGGRLFRHASIFYRAESSLWLP